MIDNSPRIISNKIKLADKTKMLKSYSKRGKLIKWY